MSTRWWAGVGIDPETQGVNAGRQLNYQIDSMLAQLDTESFSIISEGDGSYLKRYQFGTTVLTDFYDREGNRIGFGIEACGQDEASYLLHSVQTLLARWGIYALTSVWVWERTATPIAAPHNALA